MLLILIAKFKVSDVCNKTKCVLPTDISEFTLTESETKGRIFSQVQLFYD